MIEHRGPGKHILSNFGKLETLALIHEKDCDTYKRLRKCPFPKGTLLMTINNTNPSDRWSDSTQWQLTAINRILIASGESLPEVRLSYNAGSLTKTTTSVVEDGCKYKCNIKGEADVELNFSDDYSTADINLVLENPITNVLFKGEKLIDPAGLVHEIPANSFSNSSIQPDGTIHIEGTYWETLQKYVIDIDADHQHGIVQFGWYNNYKTRSSNQTVSDDADWEFDKFNCDVEFNQISDSDYTCVLKLTDTSETITRHIPANNCHNVPNVPNKSSGGDVTFEKGSLHYGPFSSRWVGGKTQAVISSFKQITQKSVPVMKTTGTMNDTIYTLTFGSFNISLIKQKYVYNNKDQGGENTIKLLEENMPMHSHNVSNSYSLKKRHPGMYTTQSSWTGVNLGGCGGSGAKGANWDIADSVLDFPDFLNGTRWWHGVILGNGGAGQSPNYSNRNIGWAGNDQPHNNIMPYMKVYIWERIS